MKIARVSGARLDLQDRDGRLDIFGTATARARAKDYVGYVLTQRTGPVFIDTTEKRDDLSIVNVPEVSTGGRSRDDHVMTATFALLVANPPPPRHAPLAPPPRVCCWTSAQLHSFGVAAPPNRRAHLISV